MLAIGSDVGGLRGCVAVSRTRGYPGPVGGSIPSAKQHIAKRLGTSGPAKPLALYGISEILSFRLYEKILYRSSGCTSRSCCCL